MTKGRRITLQRLALIAAIIVLWEAASGGFGLGLVLVEPSIIAGSPWKAIVGIYNREIVSLVVRSELKDRVKTVADLHGRKVGYSLPGTGSRYLGSLFLKKAGLDPEKDVENVFLGGDPGVIYAALKTGKSTRSPRGSRPRPGSSRRGWRTRSSGSGTRRSTRGGSGGPRCPRRSSRATT